MVHIYMLEKLFHNADLDIELTSYIEKSKMFDSEERTLLRYLVIVLLIR